MTVLVFFFADLSAPAAVCLAVGATATASIPALLLADAHRSDFDPRPALTRLVESGRLDALLVAVGPARVRRSVWLPAREACRDAAALLLLLTTSPKGAMA
jgi:hypothetical protein